MGKHYKKETNFQWEAPELPKKEEKKEAVVTISYDPPKDEFYKARIRTLEKENCSLNETLDEARQCIRDMRKESAYLRETVEEQKNEIEKLKAALVRVVIS